MGASVRIRRARPSDKRTSAVISLVEFAADKRAYAVRDRSAEILAVLDELAELARKGDLNGLLFSVELRGGRQCAGTVGTLKDDPAALAMASVKLQRLVGAYIEACED